jgi:hypothetical protein
MKAGFSCYSNLRRVLFRKNACCTIYERVSQERRENAGLALLKGIGLGRFYAPLASHLGLGRFYAPLASHLELGRFCAPLASHLGLGRFCAPLASHPSHINHSRPTQGLW